MNDGFGLMIAVCVLLGLLHGYLKSHQTQQNPTKKNGRIIKQRKKSHPEYPEEPDYPDPEDADLIEYDL